MGSGPRKVGEVLPKKTSQNLLAKFGLVDPKVCVAGFRKAGNFPFTNNAVPEEKFRPVQLAEYKKQLGQSNKPQTQDQSLELELPTPGPYGPKIYPRMKLRFRP